MVIIFKIETIWYTDDSRYVGITPNGNPSIGGKFFKNRTYNVGISNTDVGNKERVNGYTKTFTDEFIYTGNFINGMLEGFVTVETKYGIYTECMFSKGLPYGRMKQYPYRYNVNDKVNVHYAEVNDYMLTDTYEGIFIKNRLNDSHYKFAMITMNETVRCFGKVLANNYFMEKIIRQNIVKSTTIMRTIYQDGIVEMGLKYLPDGTVTAK